MIASKSINTEELKKKRDEVKSVFSNIPKSFAKFNRLTKEQKEDLETHFNTIFDAAYDAGIEDAKKWR